MASDARSIDISVVSMAGNPRATIELSDTETVGRVKRHIQAACKVPFFTQQLVLKSSVLDDGRTLSGFPERATLTLVVRPCVPLMDSRLLHAAERGDVQAAEDALRALADPNMTDAKILGPMVVASRNGHLGVVQLLHESGADVDRPTLEGATFPSMAPGAPHLEISLVPSPMQKHCKVQAGETPLFAASRRGHLRVVEFLAEVGADLDKPVESGATPLFIASQNKNLDVVRFLCERGADKDKANGVGATPLFIASVFGHWEVVRYLCSVGADANRARQGGATPLFAAAREGHAGVVGALLEVGADVDAATDAGLTPVLAAARRGHLAVVSSLRDAGADTSMAAGDGTTPLSDASQEGHLEVVRLLHAR